MDSRLRRRRPIAVCFAVALGLAGLPASALAGEGTKSTAGAHVDYSGLPLPIILNGRLENYVFIVLRLTANREEDLTLLKEREPYVRDRLLRVAHARPFTRPGDLTRLDDARILALLRGEADSLFGRGRLGKVEIASETPQRRSGLPSSPTPPTGHPLSDGLRRGARPPDMAQAVAPPTGMRL